MNLQAGSMLFNMDLPWNPAVLEQRIGRIYRQGQKKNVNIINFVAQHTIEHGMLAKLKFKRALAEGILDNGDSNIFIGDSKFNVFMKDIEGLFEDETISTSPIETEREEETEVEKTVTTKEAETTEPYEDDDEKQAESDIQPGKIDEAKNQPELQLLQTATSFFTQLGKILSDTKATENLIQSLTKKDETNGQTYLQIPVENENVVKSAFTVLAGLFKGISGK